MTKDYGTKRLGKNRIHSLVDGMILFKRSLGETGKEVNPGEEAATSPGDSGGPMLKDGEIIGVTSGFRPDLGLNVQADVTTTFARDFLAQAAGQGAKVEGVVPDRSTSLIKIIDYSYKRLAAALKEMLRSRIAASQQKLKLKLVATSSPSILGGYFWSLLVPPPVIDGQFGDLRLDDAFRSLTSDVESTFREAFGSDVQILDDNRLSKRMKIKGQEVPPLGDSARLMEAANLHGLVQVEVRLPAQDVNADNAHQKFELEVKVRLRNGETLVL